MHINPLAYRFFTAIALFGALLASAPARADEFDDTIETFKRAGASAEFFESSYGYAVFPTIGKAGLGVGGARGKGQVYAAGVPVGSATMTQLSFGFQAGGQAFSQIIFFQDERSFTEFTSGNFEFSGTASAVAITAGVSAGTGTTGASGGVSAGKNDASTVGTYYKGMAIFTVAKGGLMYEAAVAGQKFSYQPN
ncbi:MAG: lipid-binding SYLF domain-containing protein [Proteobacteria bacterium]|nr:lipid-binding SYLF domain-containing protein [Pseudomonadota bacterium]